MIASSPIKLSAALAEASAVSTTATFSTSLNVAIKMFLLDQTTEKFPEYWRGVTDESRWVYIVQEKFGSRLIKVGRSSHILARLNSYSANRFVVRAVIPEIYEGMEQDILDRLYPFLAEGKEWFFPTPAATRSLTKFYQNVLGQRVYLKSCVTFGDHVLAAPHSGAIHDMDRPLWASMRRGFRCGHREPAGPKFFSIRVQALRFLSVLDGQSAPMELATLPFGVSQHLSRRNELKKSNDFLAGVYGKMFLPKPTTELSS